MAAGAHCQVSSSCLPPSCIIFSPRLQHFIQLTRVKRVTRHFSLKIFRPKQVGRVGIHGTGRSQFQILTHCHVNFQKKKTSFLCSPANKFRWFSSPWGCESARPFQWRITLKRASMARYLDILVSYKYYFINLPQKKKRKKLRPSKWPGKYQRAFSVATRH